MFLHATLVVCCKKVGHVMHCLLKGYICTLCCIKCYSGTLIAVMLNVLMGSDV
jgi:hypothetical protein